ncbi:MAG: hypothetical protein KJ556_20925 [Gammaproteobacteria bacterium]|nr:hypothetical protein [Gammaproteobacteria bacterium]
MPKELTGLEVVRVAAVGKAANKRRWLLLKSDDAAEEDLQPVESYLAPVDFELGGQPVRKGSWVLGVHAGNPQTWQAIKSGELSGLSMFGLAQRVDGEPGNTAEETVDGKRQG